MRRAPNTIPTGWRQAETASSIRPGIPVAAGKPSRAMALLSFTSGKSPAFPVIGENSMAINGTSGNDYLEGTSSGGVINAYGGDDIVIGGYGNDYVYAGTGDDYVDGDQGDDYLDGDYGNDTLLGGNGSDQIYGGDGADYLDGGLDNDTIYGGAGNDTIFGGVGGNDYLDGGDGDDTFVVEGASGVDTYVGGAGTDTITFQDPSNASAYSYYTVGISSMSGIELIYNSTAKDAYISVYGAVSFANTALVNIAGINGSSGDDTITASAFYDSDTSSYSGAIVDAAAGSDYVYGTNGYADVIDGGDGDDVLYGYGGLDVIDGGNGDDILVGGAGGSNLTGGDGSDWFWFETGEGVHTVTDYVDGTDKMVIGTSISSINLYLYNGGADTLLEFDSGATYAILKGVSAYDIDSTDFLWAT